MPEVLVPVGNWRPISAGNEAKIGEAIDNFMGTHPRSTVYVKHSVRSMQTIMKRKSYEYPEGTSVPNTWYAHVWENSGGLTAFFSLRVPKFGNRSSLTKLEPAYCMSLALSKRRAAAAARDADEDLNEIRQLCCAIAEPTLPFEILSDQSHQIETSPGSGVYMDCPTDDPDLVEIWRLAIAHTPPFIIFDNWITPDPPFSPSYRWFVDPQCPYP